MLKISLHFLRNLQTSRANNLRILRIKNVKFSGYCFYLNTKVKQVNNVTADLPSDMITILLWFYICYCCNFIFFGHFSLCSRTKLRLRDSTFDMQLIPHVWDS